MAKKDTDFPMMTLAQRCYTSGKQKRAEDIAKTNPFPPFGSLPDPWKVYDDFYNNNHWDAGLIGPMATWKSRPLVPFCFRGVESYTTFLTDSRPALEIGPVEPDDAIKAEIIDAGVDRWWDEESMDTTLAYAVKDSRKYGIGWLHLTGGKDGIHCKVINPQNVIVDPDATCESYDPTWLQYEYKAPYAALKKAFEKNKDIDWEKFNPDWKPQDDPENSTRVDTRYAADRISKNPNITCNVLQFWTQDDAKITWDEEFGGNSVVTKQKKAHPKGRALTIAGGQVMEDKDNPNDHGEFPFTPIFAYPSTGRFYPVGDIELILPLQVMYNRMMQLLYDQTVKNSGFVALCNPNLGVDKDDISNNPAYALNCRDVTAALKFERPPSPSRHVFDFLMVLEKGINDALGLHDISMGVRSPGNPMTAEEAGIISESDMTRVRAAARLLEWSIKRFGNQLLRLMKQYHKEEWIVRIAGNYSYEVGIDDGMDVTPTLTSDTTETFTGKDIITDDMLKYDLTVRADSSLPFNQQQNTQQTQWMYGAGLIDEEETLRRLGENNYREMAARSPARLAREEQHIEGGKVTANAPVQPEGMPQGGMPPDMGALPPMPGGGAPMAPAPLDLGGGAPPPEEFMAQIMEAAAQMGVDPEELIAQLMGGMNAGAPSPL